MFGRYGIEAPLRGPELVTLTFASSGNLIADRRYAFGCELASRGDLAAAADLFAQAAEAEPAFAAAWFALGETVAKLGDRADAVAVFERALALDPQDRCGAALHLARLGAADPARAMSNAYVRTLFDQYAPRFDDALEALAYRGPQLLLDAVTRARPEKFAAALDLGCGTGLAGAAFRPCVAHLAGVDLSPGMIARCRAKGIYDRLEAEELAAFLEAERTAQRRYDLVVAADVFAYLYDLAPVVQAVADVLGPVGIVAVTVETQEDDGVGDGMSVALGEKLRYRHGAGHVRAAIAAAGLALIELAPATTRTEAGEAVPGLVAVARKHSGRSECLP
jgi:predicted TPR repeat methyltransferase